MTPPGPQPGVDKSGNAEKCLPQQVLHGFDVASRKYLFNLEKSPILHCEVPLGASGTSRKSPPNRRTAGLRFQNRHQMVANRMGHACEHQNRDRHESFFKEMQFSKICWCLDLRWIILKFWNILVFLLLRSLFQLQKFTDYFVYLSKNHVFFKKYTYF